MVFLGRDVGTIMVSCFTHLIVTRQEELGYKDIPHMDHPDSGNDERGTTVKVCVFFIYLLSPLDDVINSGWQTKGIPEEHIC